MALVQFGVSVTGIRGTIGGLTFSANKHGNYAKSWARPPKSKSPNLNVVKAAPAYMCQLWQALDPGVQTDWNDFAAAPNEHDYDPWGVEYFLSGYQWFIRAQIRRYYAFLSLPGDVPSGAAATAPTGVTATIYADSAPDSVLNWDSASFGATDAAAVYASISPAQSLQWRTTGWKWLVTAVNPGDTELNISTALDTAFGSLIEGWYIYIRLYKQADAGNRSSPTDIRAQVQAAP